MNNLFKISLCAMSLMFSSGVMAATGTGHAQAELSSPLIVENERNVNFGIISIDPASGPQTIGINLIGQFYSCPTGYLCGGSPQHGLIRITGGPNTDVNIALSATGILSDGAGHTITYRPVLGTGSLQSLYGSGITSVPVRGEIDFTGSEVAGTYSTANAGGTPYIVTVNY
ncbi:MAG: DUF4402 domain-containing protein [Alphaproteobacteria bacterium]|nr:DUF4402 domain-containing protein [Alphaproteobacteria bacterium]MBN2780171.1 DUF4402 domain-containing protein [Alphaproteobacteria bacterium]